LRTKGHGVCFVYSAENESEEEKALISLLEAPYQLEPPIKRFKRADVQQVIRYPKPKKSSSYDLITGRIHKELLIIGIKYLTQFSMLFCSKDNFQAQWKVTQAILILKSGKPSNELTSYRPISLLPIVSKIVKSSS
jgi:hypothetical protein